MPQIKPPSKPPHSKPQQHRSRHRRRPAVESLESRVCMSVVVALPVTTLTLSGDTLSSGAWQRESGGNYSLTLNRDGDTIHVVWQVSTYTASSAGGTTVTFGTLVLGDSRGQDRSNSPPRDSRSNAPKPTPAPTSTPTPAPSDAPGDASGPVIAPPTARPNDLRALADEHDQQHGSRSLAVTTIDDALRGTSASGVTASFIPKAASTDSLESSISSPAALADRTLDRLWRLSSAEGPFASTGSIAAAQPIRAEEFVAPAADEIMIAAPIPTTSRPAFADVAVSMVAHTTASMISNPAMPGARYFGFSPMGMPATLVSDSIAAFAEQSASISAGVAVQARAVVFPWAFTFSVLAADLVLLSYIHRRALRQRLAHAVHWPLVPRPALTPAV